MWMHIVEALINAEQFVLNHWQVWSEYVGWALGATSLLQYLKRKYKLDQRVVSILGWWRVDGPRIMTVIYAVVAAASAGVTWLINPANAAYIPTRFAFLVSIGVAVHRFIVSPASQKLEAKFKPYVEALERLQTMEQIVPTVNVQKAAMDYPMQATQENPAVGSVVNPNDTAGR